MGADLGVVLGTRVLKRAIFDIPRLGCVNLHKGRVPEYRGMPPGFWELYDGAASAGVTVHFVDDGLDTGDVLGTSEIPIHGKETPESLSAKLNLAGSALLASVVRQIQDGTAQRRSQPRSAHQPRTIPTRAQQNELAVRLPHWRRHSEIRQVAKFVVWLVVFHTRLYVLLRLAQPGRSRGAILLYHRVNDVSDDVLTTNTRRFAEHLVTLRHYYRIVPTEQMVEQIAARARLSAGSGRDSFRRLLSRRPHPRQRVTARRRSARGGVCILGFVDTDRAFQHDLDKYPHTFENFHEHELRELPGLGVTVAAHTVNHVDLGQVDPEGARVEVFESRRQLERMTGAPVLLFSFPFGGIQNIRPEVRSMVMEAGYQALFSAHGGFISEETEIYDIPRIGVSSEHSPLALIMELEGLSLANLRYHWRRRRAGRGRLNPRC